MEVATLGQQTLIQHWKQLKGKYPHAILLQAPVDSMHLATAVYMAAIATCQSPHPPCYQCACKAFIALQSPDIFLLFPATTKAWKEPEKLYESFFQAWQQTPFMNLALWSEYLKTESQSFLIPIESVRRLKEKIYYSPYHLPQKWVFIWYAERMNPQAANALLKLLEEPPKDTFFILTTEDSSALLPTILSRCQRFIMQPIPKNALQQYFSQVSWCDSTQATSLAKVVDTPAQGYQLLHSKQLEAIQTFLPQWLQYLQQQQWQALQSLLYQWSHSSKTALTFLLLHLAKQFRQCLHAALNFCSLPKDTPLSTLAHSRYVPLLQETLEKLNEGIYLLNRNSNMELWLWNFSLWFKRCLNS